MNPQSLYNEILQNIKNIYIDFERTANERAEDKRIKSGTKVDKQ